LPSSAALAAFRPLPSVCHRRPVGAGRCHRPDL